MAYGIMTEVYQGHMNYVEAAKKLGLDAQKVWNCFANHWDVVMEDEKLHIKLKEAVGADDYVSILKDQVKFFLDRLEQAKKSTLSFNPGTEKSLVMLCQEMRNCMKDILTFEGKLNTGVIIQYNIINIQMTKLTMFLLSNLCEEDKKKLTEALPGIISESAQSVNKKGAELQCT
jgi:hypothetical protein